MQTRRALITGRHSVIMETIDLDHDHPREGELLLETQASYISAGTELANYTGLDPNVDRPGSWCAYPWTPGYANVARVLDAGPDQEQHWKPGDRVFTFNRHTAVHFSPAHNWGVRVRVPDGLSDVAAAASRMASVAITALQVADVALNDWVAVFGLGAVGNLAAQFFKLCGARVIGVDPFPLRRQLAQRVGIEHTVGGSEEEVAQAIRDLTEGHGARITVDAVGDSRVIRQAAKVTATHGEVIMLGSPRAAVEGDITDAIHPVHWRWVTYKGALEWRVPMQPATGVRHSIQGNLETIFDLVLHGRLDVTSMISHQLPAEQIKQAYEGLLNEKDHYTGVALIWK